MYDYNPILNVDSYKTSHYLQYPPGTQYISSYIESRGGDYPHALFFGLQAFIKQYLIKPVKAKHIEEAQQVLTQHGLPFNRAGWEYILNKHDGLLPVYIEAVPEGTLLPNSNVMLQAVNTDPECYWLTSYIETAMLRSIWYPTTVATLSHAVKQVIREYLDTTADNLDSLPFKLHDFGARGASSLESSALGGLGHLVNFQGTDTLSAVIAARDYYGEQMAGFSIPAAEHSTITAWGRDRECEAFGNMLDQFSGPDRLVAVVSDSYNLWQALESYWGKELKARVQTNGGTVVVRPDSGDPVKVVSKTLEILLSRFGCEYTSNGYKLLPPFIRVIQGDGVNLQSIKAILKALKSRRISAENITFGMGGALLQKVNRDTLKFAMKASAARINGNWIDIFKDPVTDHGKRSKKGRLALVQSEGEYRTIALSELGEQENILQPVFRNGKLLREQSLDDVRQRCAMP